MDQKTQKMLDEFNRAIIKFRGVYSEWSRTHDIGYNEMLVLYTIRDNGYCTQKQICDNYLLPRQTINNVFTRMKKEGILVQKKREGTGREKVFVLSQKGEAYAKGFLDSLNAVEEQAVKLMGEEKIDAMTRLVLEYDEVLKRALDSSRQGE